MASNIIEVSPLPPGTTHEHVTAAFQLYSVEKVAVVGDKAYILFNDVGIVQQLDFTFPDLKVAQLNNAQINPVLGQFSWPDAQSPPKIVELSQTQVTHVEEEKQPKVQIKPQFIVVNNCTKHTLQRHSQDSIKKNIFPKYKIGRVQKLNQDLYVEFLDDNEIQLLAGESEDLRIPALGVDAQIARVEKPFDISKIKQQSIQAEAQQKRQRQEKIKKEMEQRKRQVKIQETKLPNVEVDKNKTGAIPPPPKREEPRESSIKVNSSSEKSFKPISASLLWNIIVISWGLYVLYS